MHLPSGRGDDDLRRVASATWPRASRSSSSPGKEYGSGSSRDWAAKGPEPPRRAAVIAESYERIHRSNLVGMGILPLQFADGENAESLGLTGRETFAVRGLENGDAREATVEATADDGVARSSSARGSGSTRRSEREYLRAGGILPSCCVGSWPSSPHRIARMNYAFAGQPTSPVFEEFAERARRARSRRAGSSASTATARSRPTSSSTSSTRTTRSRSGAARAGRSSPRSTSSRRVPDDILKTNYPLLVRALANIVLCYVPDEGVWFTTMERGHYGVEADERPARPRRGRRSSGSPRSRSRSS